MSLRDYLFHEEPGITLYCGDVRLVLPLLEAQSVQCVVTSPPYWGLRDYGVDGQLGLEATPDEYRLTLAAVFSQVMRVLREDGTCWLNLGDSYITAPHGQGDTFDPKWPGGRDRSAEKPNRSSFRRDRREREDEPHRPAPGLKPKDLAGIPWRVAFTLQECGWYLRSDIIWHKPNTMPESVTDRPTKAHEYLFLLAKSERYHYYAEAIAEVSIDSVGVSRGGSLARFGRGEQLVSANAHRGEKEYASNGRRNRRSVWTIATEPYPSAHFATFPTDLVKPCVLAGAAVGSVVLDPFAGSGTVLHVAKELGRHAIGIELNPEYCRLAVKRLRQEVLL